MMDKELLINEIQDRFEAAKIGPNSCWNEQDSIDEYMKGGSRKAVGNGVKAQPELNVDLILVAVEGQSAILNDSPVDILVTPRTPQYELDATIYQQVVNHTLYANQWERLRDQVQKYALINKVGIIKLRVVQKGSDNRIKLEAVNPRYIYLDPTATTQEDADYCIEVVRMSRKDLEKKYPKANLGSADIVQPDEFLQDFNSGEDDKDSEKVHCYEYWKMDEDKAKYPYGRYVLATDTDILEDRPNAYPCGLPYVFASCYSVPDRVYGRGSFQSLKSLQDEIGMLYRRMSNITKIAANPTLMLSTLSGLDYKQVTNKDGAVLPVALPDVRSAMAWEYGPGVSPAMMGYADKLQYMFDTISGFHDVLQGRAVINSNVPSGKSIDELQAASQTRIRQMMRNIKSAVGILGQKIIAIVNDSYDTEDVVRITGSDVESVKQVLERNYREALNAMAQAGAVSEEEFQTGLAIYFREKGIRAEKTGSEMFLHYHGTRLGDPNDVQLKVTAGTDIPKNKLDVAAAAQQLMAGGLLDPQTYMEAIDFPLRDKALQRNQMWQAFQQFMAQQQQVQAQTQGQAPQGAPQDTPAEGMAEGQPMNPEPGLQEPTGVV
jgi:hypothetical protein